MYTKMPEINSPFQIVTSDTDKGKRLYGTLLFSESRDAEINTGENIFLLKAGNMVYFRPMIPYITNGGELTELRIDIHTLELPFPYAYRAYPVLGESWKTDEPRKISKDCKDKIRKLMTALTAEEDSFSLSSYTTLLRLIDLLTDGYSDDERSDRTDFYSISEYIDFHSAEPLEVGSLAEMCDMSYPNFARRFHEYYGRSCKEHISHVRTVKARRLLRNTDLDLSVIAAETGFFDSSHLIRTYKKLMGMTPNRERTEK